MKKLLFLALLIFTISNSYSQTGDTRLGTQYINQFQKRGGFYDYSNPETINMKVSIWGFVKYPGRYIVPINTEVSDLLSYAGGPNQNTNLDDLRLYRIMEDSTQHMFKFDLEDLLWNNKLEVQNRKIPKLQGSDVLVVPGEPRLFFRNWLRIGLQLFSVLASLTFLIIRIHKMNNK